MWVGQCSDRFVWYKSGLLCRLVSILGIHDLSSLFAVEPEVFWSCLSLDVAPCGLVNSYQSWSTSLLNIKVSVFDFVSHFIIGTKLHLWELSSAPSCGANSRTVLTNLNTTVTKKRSWSLEIVQTETIVLCLLWLVAFPFIKVTVLVYRNIFILGGWGK